MRSEKRWIPCRVFPGMFSDELVVEVNDRSLFVNRDAVRARQGDQGEVLVRVFEADGTTWAVMPTNASDSIPLGA